MRLALLRAIAKAVPDADNMTEAKVAALWEVANGLFKFEREILILGEPSEKQREEHREAISFLRNVVKPLARLSGDEQLILLQKRLDDSWGMFCEPMSETEADEIHAKLSAR